MITDYLNTYTGQKRRFSKHVYIFAYITDCGPRALSLVFYFQPGVSWLKTLVPTALTMSSAGSMTASWGPAHTSGTAAAAATITALTRSANVARHVSLRVSPNPALNEWLLNVDSGRCWPCSQCQTGSRLVSLQCSPPPACFRGGHFGFRRMLLL